MHAVQEAGNICNRSKKVIMKHGSLTGSGSFEENRLGEAAGNKPNTCDLLLLNRRLADGKGRRGVNLEFEAGHPR